MTVSCTFSCVVSHMGNNKVHLKGDRSCSGLSNDRNVGRPGQGTEPKSPLSNVSLGGG